MAPKPYRECSAEERRKRIDSTLRMRAKKLAIVKSYKAARSCRVCGETDPVVLELHHRDPGTKHPKLSPRRNGKRIQSTGGEGWRRLSFAEMAVELEKCDVLCANCHRRETHRQRQEAHGREEQVVALVEADPTRLSLF